jgi:hypothetical protein
MFAGILCEFLWACYGVSEKVNQDMKNGMPDAG